jgi:hypothetical protein
MRRWIVIGAGSVSGYSENHIADDDARADWNFAMLDRSARRRESLAHPVRVRFALRCGSHNKQFTSNNGKFNYRCGYQTLSSE